MNARKLERSIKIVLGIMISIFIAEAAGLRFAASTGIVAMLGMQNTRKETIHTALKRCLSFAYTILIAYVIHTYIGSKTVEFALVILTVTMLTFVLEWQDTLSVNIVVAVHLFLQHQTFTTVLIGNEAERVLIGMLVAIVVNWHHPTSEEVFEKMIEESEQQLQQVLRGFAEFFKGNTSVGEIASKLHSYGKQLDQMMERAYTYSNNHLSQHAMFYEQYMCMRVKEYGILENIIRQMQRFRELPTSSVLVSAYIQEVSESVSVRESTDCWENSFSKLQSRLQLEAMPTDYSELVDRANMLGIVKEMMTMIQIKREFIAALSLEQRRHYYI